MPNERYVPPQRFEAMEQVAANDKCGRGLGHRSRTECPVCEMAVFLHCDQCKIQITGCLCTAKERMTEEEFANFKQELREQQSRALAERARAAGLITPN